MKAIAVFCLACLLMGFNCLISYPADASNTQDCHQFSSYDLSHIEMDFCLSKDQIEALKLEFISASYDSHLSKIKDRVKLIRQRRLDSLKQSVSANPFNIAAWNNLGYELFRLSLYQESLEVYDHVLMLSPRYSLGLANRCGVLSKLGQYVKALASCDLALMGDERWGMEGPELAWNNRGDVLFNLELYPESLRSFERALAVNADYKSAQLNRMIVLGHLKKVPQQNAGGSNV